MMKLWVFSLVLYVMGIGSAAFAQADISLVINELTASNSSDGGFADPQGDFDDWFEIYNFGETAIDMGGMYLTDDLSEPAKWRIPDNSPIETTVSAHGYLLIWADNDISDGPLHVGFNLSKNGEQIGLTASDGITMIDAIVFGEQITNTSYGRYPDAGRSAFFYEPDTGCGKPKAILRSR